MLPASAPPFYVKKSLAAGTSLAVWSVLGPSLLKVLIMLDKLVRVAGRPAGHGRLFDHLIDVKYYF